MNKFSQLPLTLCCAPGKWGTSFCWFLSFHLAPLIACSRSGAIGRKSRQLDPETAPLFTPAVSILTEHHWTPTAAGGASSSGPPGPLFWLGLLVWYRSINQGWKPCCVYTAGVTHGDSDLYGAGHVQRAGKREQKMCVKSSERLDSPAAHSWAVTSSHVSCFFPSQVRPDSRFPPVCVGLFHVCCWEDGKASMLLWRHRELKESCTRAVTVFSQVISQRFRPSVWKWPKKSKDSNLRF